jgi:glycosyltransferase involved in cell wall biosynthesis
MHYELRSPAIGSCMVAPGTAPAPRVAVVIPCHDDGRTLPDALASLEAEEPHELVVVDDGSTDPDTLRLLDELRTGGVRVIRQENAGPGAARMAGVGATSAPYVFPLDADDVLESGALAALADALDRHPEASAAWGDEPTFGRIEVDVRTPDHLDPWLVT